jgi:hypothetical protein
MKRNAGCGKEKSFGVLTFKISTPKIFIIKEVHITYQSLFAENY